MLLASERQLVGSPWKLATSTPWIILAIGTVAMPGVLASILALTSTLASAVISSAVLASAVLASAAVSEGAASGACASDGGASEEGDSIEDASDEGASDEGASEDATAGPSDGVTELAVSGSVPSSTCLVALLRHHRNAMTGPYPALCSVRFALSLPWPVYPFSGEL